MGILIFGYLFVSLSFGLMIAAAHDFEDTRVGRTILAVKVLLWPLTLLYIIFTNKKDLPQ